jgi:hypothetical protein
MDGLGRVFNVVPEASSLYISMETCSAISYICKSNSSDVYTIREAKDSSGTSVQDVGNVLTHYYTTTDVDGSVAWTKVTQTAADETGTITTGSIVVFTVLTSWLDDGFDYVQVTGGGSTVIALLHDLTVQRAPANLALPGE